MIRLLLCLAACAVILAAGCRQSQQDGPSAQNVQIELTVEPNPPVPGDAQLVVTVRDARGQPIDDAALNARGDMSHAGMTPVIRDVTTGQNGIYRVPFQWTMSGDWVVEITARLKDGSTATRQFKLTVGSGGSTAMPADASVSGMGDMDTGSSRPTESASQ